MFTKSSFAYGAVAVADLGEVPATQAEAEAAVLPWVSLTLFQGRLCQPSLLVPLELEVSVQVQPTARLVERLLSERC